MLVLSRRIGERIVVGNSIFITLVATQGDNARIGIEAPRDVAVDRHEVHLRKAAERRLAGDAPPYVGQPQ